jgi:hypothetical protein
MGLQGKEWDAMKKLLMQISNRSDTGTCPTLIEQLTAVSVDDWRRALRTINAVVLCNVEARSEGVWLK